MNPCWPLAWSLENKLTYWIYIISSTSVYVNYNQVNQIIVWLGTKFNRTITRFHARKIQILLFTYVGNKYHTNQSK